MQRSDAAHGIIYVLAAAFLWGTTGTAQALSPAGFDPAVVGALRLLIGGLLLIPSALRGGAFRTLRRSAAPALFASALCLAAYQLSFFSAVARTGVAVGTVVGIGSAPVFGGILGHFVLRERLRLRWWIATGLSLGGGVILSTGNASTTVDAAGILLAVGAGASYAAYSLLVKQLLLRFPRSAVLAAVTCGGALMLAPLLLRLDPGWLWQGRSIAVALYLGGATMALAYSLFSRGLASVSLSAATTLTLAEPAAAATLGILLLGERPDSTALTGIALIVAGLAVLTLGNRRGSVEGLRSKAQLKTG